MLWVSDNLRQNKWMIKPTAMKYVIGKFSLFYFYYYSAFWLEYCQNIWTCGFYLFSLPVSTIPPLPQNCKSFQISVIRFLDEYFKFWRAYVSLKIILQAETVIEKLDEFQTVSLIVRSLVSKNTSKLYQNWATFVQSNC